MTRFNNLEDVYNTLVAINFDFNTLPATNKYRKYAEWKQDPELRKLPEGSAQEQGTRFTVGIRPFGLLFADTNKVKIKLSGRVNDNITALGGYGIYHLETTEAALVDFVPKVGYKPGKAILAAKLSNPVVVSASDNRITGRAYKKRTGETFTVPYGRADATSTEFAEQDLIIADRAATHVVTFVPEKLARR